MIRKATIGDVEHIHKLINSCAEKNLMLPRSLSELYEKMRDFFVYEKNGRVVGCVACHIFWKNLAEVRSLAVAPRYRKKGIGSQLVETCKDESRSLGITKLFVLTNTGNFFKSLGFRKTSKEELPNKIWSDCIKCPKFPNCDEEAYVIYIKRKA